MARKAARGGFKVAKNYDPYRNRANAKKRETSKNRVKTVSNEEAKAAYDRRAKAPKKVTFAPIEAKQTHPNAVQNVSFEDLGVGRNLRETLVNLGADTPFAIQAVTIPDAMAGENVLAKARTGSGKTIAFGVSTVERLMMLGSKRSRDQVRKPRAIILAPTRELALQIDKSVQPLARSVGLFTAQLVGGLPIASQTHALKRGVDIVIGTPGRVEDLMRRGQLDLRDIEIAVIDEADHMAELGFIEPVQRILRQLRVNVQVMLFSATLDAEVQLLVNEFLPEHVAHEIVVERSEKSNVKHSAFVVNREDKNAILRESVRLALKNKNNSVLIFTRTKFYAELVSADLVAAGFSALALHGDLSQQRRINNLEKFTQKKAAVLVATDVAARGIHVDAVDLVIQADVPDDFKAYLHRSGRTGRAGERGAALTLVPRTRQKFMRNVFEQSEIEPRFFGECFVETVEELFTKNVLKR